MDIEELHQLFLQSTGACTDTRNIKENGIYFALKGERFNGNEYALSALEKGASWAVVDESIAIENPRLVRVGDVLQTLQDLAHVHRKHLGITVIGITGSNGKTTTKELMRDVLAKKYRLHATRGNLNNHIGVPLTLLELTGQHELAIIEMGANHLGEINLLSRIADPDLGLITNIGRAHIGEFGGYQNIITAKTELFEYLKSKNAKAFVHGESEILLEKSTGLEQFIYGRHPQSQVHCQLTSADPYLELDWEGQHIITQLIGDYNLSNICAAIALGKYFEVASSDIISAISEYDPDNNRSQLVEKAGRKIIMDAYNANPDSMEAALKNLSNMAGGSKLAILGDMLELGDESLSAHKKIIALANQLGLEAVYVGPEFIQAAEDLKSNYFEKTADLASELEKHSLDSDLILIKGSRGIRLEGLLEIL